MPPDLIFRQETPRDAAAVEDLYAGAFGPGRYARAAYLLRDGTAHDPLVSVVADRRGLVIGAIRQTRVTVGGDPAYLLGPLAVAETAAKQGIGKALLSRSIAATRATFAHAIVLVGDAPFYAALGFKQVFDAVWLASGPAERHRMLALTLRAPVTGEVRAGEW